MAGAGTRRASPGPLAGVQLRPPHGNERRGRAPGACLLAHKINSSYEDSNKSVLADLILLEMLSWRAPRCRPGGARGGALPPTGSRSPMRCAGSSTRGSSGSSENTNSESWPSPSHLSSVGSSSSKRLQPRRATTLEVDGSAARPSGKDRKREREREREGKKARRPCTASPGAAGDEEEQEEEDEEEGEREREREHAGLLGVLRRPLAF
ncbi:unnamed protein product [Prorocentrum cordatum]|uniref:Uncharacterized protein n=1 Tax=Prorocentrum cordatum TaxID=2364126 RepID=A0ABN9SVF2_9DINO|nr:unnamed protein product [Polarella glacialis]